MLTEAARLISVRLADRGWTQVRLRQEMDKLAPHRKVPNGLVCRWIDGTRTPSAERVALLAELLGIDAKLWRLRPKKAA